MHNTVHHHHHHSHSHSHTYIRCAQYTKIRAHISMYMTLFKYNTSTRSSTAKNWKLYTSSSSSLPHHTNTRTFQQAHKIYYAITLWIKNDDSAMIMQLLLRPLDLTKIMNTHIQVHHMHKKKTTSFIESHISHTWTLPIAIIIRDSFEYLLLCCCYWSPVVF